MSLGGLAMLCVIIGRGRHSSLAEEWKAAAEAGAELVEIRADCLLREPDLRRILKERPTPLVFTLRRGAEGGLWSGNEERRQQLLREAIVLGVDYVDLEMDIARKIRRFGKTKRIVSYHNFKGTPEELPEIAEQCDEMDADVVKIATRAASLADASRVLQIHTHTAVPTIPVAMGDIGTFTRVLGAKFGAPFTYAGFNPERTFAPGMLTFHELKRNYLYDQINAATEVFAVIGDPIAQSLSPAIHNAAFRHLGMNKVMVPLLIPAGTLEASLKELEWLQIKGMSVTIPHKEAIIPLLTQTHGTIDLTGACNTVVFENGKKIGSNTDYRAAMDSLEQVIEPDKDRPDTSPLDEKQVLILGAGGAARSIAFGVAHRGAHLQITNRHDDRATALAEQVGCRTVSWAVRASTWAQVLINCTPVGMHPDVDDTPMPPAGLKEGMVVFDTVYHPENTMLLKLARERGCKTITGVEMFVRQAAQQFKLYTGQDAPMDLMRDVLKRKLGPICL
jgi:3-dehydroquinate dehydratase/shikimate dehydrogenase